MKNMSGHHSWLKRCNIKYCKNEFNINISYFNVPRDPALFKKWSQAVYCTGTLLPHNGRVCEKHFDPNDIIEFKCSKKNEKAKDPESAIIEHVIIRVPRLGAAPSVFVEEIAEYTKQLELNNVKPLPKLSDILTICENTAPKSQALPLIKRSPVPVIKPKTPEEIFFDKIYDRLVEPRLPSKSWNIHNYQHPQRGIVFAELVTLNPDNAIPPILKKSVFFDEKFNMRIHFFGKYFSNVEYSTPKSIKDLEDLLRQIDCFKLCEGGPHLLELSESKYAFRDVGVYKWRHNNCEFRLEKGQICKNCQLLSKIVGQCTNDILNKKKSTSAPSPIPKKKIKLNQNEVKENQRQSKR